MPTWEVERGGVVLELETPTGDPPTQEQIRQAFASLPMARTEDFVETQAEPEGSALRRFAAGAGTMLNPLTIAKGLIQTISHPIDTASAIVDMHKAELEKGRQLSQMGTERGIETAGHYLAASIPVLGPIAANIGERISETGDVARGLGEGTGLATSVVAGPAAMRATGRVVGKAAKPLVRSAIKPTVAAARSQAGASITGLNAQADRLAQFIVDNGITTPDKAQAIIARTEGLIQQAVKGSRNVTDAPQRAQRYLAALERSAAKQGLNADDVAVIRSKAAELLNSSPLAEDVTTMVMQPSPTGLVTAGGQPVMVPTPVTQRALRTDVMPDEALDLARGSGKWGNKKAWGEQKGASREASKAVERANRDAVKAAVPETKPLFKREGQAIESKKALDRMEFREGNREPFSPFDATTAAVELGHGRLPVLAVARHVLREKKIRLGVWSKQLERALANNDEAAAAVVLDRLGLYRAATSPTESRTGLKPAIAAP